MKVERFAIPAVTVNIPPMAGENSNHPRKEKIDAVLHHVSFFRTGKFFSGTGSIEADAKERFRDGDKIYTSSITGKFKNILKTRNTVYYIASYADGFEDWEFPKNVE